MFAAARAAAGRCASVAATGGHWAAGAAAPAVSTGWSDTQIRAISRKSWKKRRPNPKPRLMVTLLETIPNLGVQGDTAAVKRGYGRDFLIPRGLAKYAVGVSASALAGGAPEAGGGATAEALEADASRRVAAFLAKHTVRVVRKEGGSWAVDAGVLADKCAKQLRLEVPPERIRLDQPLVTFGRHDVPVLVDDGTPGALRVDIVRR